MRLDHARFLVKFTAVMEFSAMSNKEEQAAAPQMKDILQKPKLESRQFRSHTMDNVKVRRMCDELLHLEDQGHDVVDKGRGGQQMWMRTLQMSVGRNVAELKM